MFEGLQTWRRGKKNKNNHQKSAKSWKLLCEKEKKQIAESIQKNRREDSEGTDSSWCWTFLELFYIAVLVTSDS